MKNSINRNQLKYIAIVAMLIDHIGWTFVETYTLLGQAMHFIGRLTGPIMAFMIYEGYVHTRDVRKYALRLGIFTLISWPAYSYYETGRPFTANFGVIFTLFLALLVIWMWDKTDLKLWVKLLIVIAACGLSMYGDWPIFDILWPLLLFINKDDKQKMWRSFAIVMAAEVLLSNATAITSDHPFVQAFQFGAFLVLPLLMYCYNGESGKKNAFNKWFFYIFYPLHLVALALLATYVFV
ncbi:MAG: hypothetical protein J5728_09010 [Lachnospiraceae bacterium]|nr:hypothetical protein [Lachnospiraceae bacterium]